MSRVFEALNKASAEKKRHEEHTLGSIEPSATQPDLLSDATDQVEQHLSGMATLSMRFRCLWPKMAIGRGGKN